MVNVGINMPYKYMDAKMWLETWGGSSLAPHHEGISNNPSSLAPFQALASDGMGM